MDELLFAGFCLILYWTYEYMINKYTLLEEILLSTSNKWNESNVELKMKINILRIQLATCWNSHDELLKHIEELKDDLINTKQKIVKIHDIVFDNSKDMKEHVYCKLMEAIV